MDNDFVVEQIVRSLSFEVEAIPQDNIIHLTTTTKSAPLNVKIRVRKKEEGFQHGLLSLPKPNRPDTVTERVRLAGSDQTIMSFNVVMEADFQKPIKKPRKNIMGIFKPSMCLGTEPDGDDYAYMPSNSYTANINKESTSKSEGALMKFTLSKDVDNDETSTKAPKRNKDIFGKCKPGGCLDPPFGEDTQPYVPAKVDDHIAPFENVIEKRTAEPTVENTARTSSIFSNKLFNWKRKKSKEEALEDNLITKETKAESVIDLYQAGSLLTSATYSNSIMTYPPTLNSSDQFRIQEEKQRGSRIYNNSSKNSFNVHSGSYFIMPRKPKNVLDKNNTAKVVEYGSDLKVDKIHRTSVDETNITTNQQDLEDNKTKQDLEIKDLPTKEVIITKKDSSDPLASKHDKDINHVKTSVDRNNITKQRGLEDDETKHAFEIKDSPTTDVNVTVKDSISSLKSEINKYFNDDKTFVDLNNITNQQDPKDDETKPDLAYTLPTTDVNITGRDIMISSESKNKPDLTDDPIFNTLLTQIEPIESKNISTQRQDELVIPNLNCISDSVIEKQKSFDDSMADAMKKYELEQNVDVEIVKAISVDEISLVTTVVDHKKSTPLKEPSFDHQHLTDTAIETIQQNQVNENKSADKSGVTIDAKYEISVFDITSAFEENPETKPTLNIKNKTSAEGLIEEGLMAIPTPIKRDPFLEIINADEDDLQQIWKNKTNPLTSDIKLNTENELNKKDNIMFDSLNNNINALDEASGKESFSRSETQTLLSENKLNELIQTQYETLTQSEIKSVISQTAEISLLDNLVKQNVSLADNNSVPIDTEYEIDSVTSQKLEEILFVRHSSTTSVVAEFANNRDFSYAKTSEKENTAARQTQSEAFANIEPDNMIISNANDTNFQRDSIYEIKKNEDKTELTNNEIEDNKLQQQPRKNSLEYTTKTTEAIADQNVADGKKFMFDKEKKVPKLDQNDHFDLESEFYFDSKPDSQRTEAASEITSFDRPIPNEHSSSLTQASEITPKHKVRPILLNIAIQSYIDDDNQVIVKSYDANILPQRYPQDSLKVTKRYIETGDKIQIPIDAENNLYIQIKSNKERYISGMEGSNAEKDTTNKWVDNKYESELDHFKSNVAIAEDIRTTLEAVYEKELLPLRNTISELRENMEMLTMHYMVLKGHMFVKKARYTKITLNRKCGCMKK